MDPQIVWTVAAAAWFLTTIAAIAHQVVHEVSWHELEEYCNQQRAPESLFGRIFDLRERISLGTLLVMIFAAALAVACTGNQILPDVTEGQPFLFWLRVVAICAVLVLAGALIPWAVAQVSAKQFLFHTWRVWWVMSGLAWPLVVSAEFIEQTLSRASGISEEKQEELEEEAAEDEIMTIVAEAEHDGHIHEDTRDMIEGVMELDDYDVGRIMTPRSRIDALDLDTQWDDMVTYIVESGRTRIPVFEGTIDRIIGILYAKDILRESLRSESKRRPLAKLLREPLEVPESTRLDEMLQKFLSQHVHMAIVKDEYRGVAGVVTIEDVLEEIVGEIVDETDNEEMDEITRISDTVAEVTGTTHVHRLNEVMGLQLPEDQEFDTVSGLIMKQLNEIPRPGRELEMDNVLFRVEQANRRYIELIHVEIQTPSKRNRNGK